MTSDPRYYKQIYIDCTSVQTKDSYQKNWNTFKMNVTKLFYLPLELSSDFSRTPTVTGSLPLLSLCNLCYQKIIQYMNNNNNDKNNNNVVEYKRYHLMMHCMSYTKNDFCVRLNCLANGYRRRKRSFGAICP